MMMWCVGNYEINTCLIIYKLMLKLTPCRAIVNAQYLVYPLYPPSTHPIDDILIGNITPDQLLSTYRYPSYDKID